MAIVWVLKTSASQVCSRPFTSCVLPVPAGPASISGLPMLTSRSIQYDVDADSPVGTVTDAISMVAESNFISVYAGESVQSTNSTFSTLR